MHIDKLVELASVNEVTFTVASVYYMPLSIYNS